LTPAREGRALAIEGRNPIASRWTPAGVRSDFLKQGPVGRRLPQ